MACLVLAGTAAGRFVGWIILFSYSLDVSRVKIRQPLNFVDPLQPTHFNFNKR